MELVKSAAPCGEVLQLKTRLLGVSPIVWRRVLVPECASLRELRGVVQLAMGWEGMHLFEFATHGTRYVGPCPGGPSTDVPLSDFRFRRNARFRYVYDMYCEWVSRAAFSRVLNARAAVSVEMALALKALGWGTAEFWVRMQGDYDLTLARRARAA